MSRRRRSLAESKPAQTYVAWIGEAIGQMWLDDVPVLSSQLRVVDIARNLGVVVDSQLSMSAQSVSSLSWRLLSAAATAATQGMHDGRSH